MRVVTRGDMDGLTCAVLLSVCEDVDEVALIHPHDLTEDRFEVRSDDILANVPYHPRCGKWFDHHLHVSVPVQAPTTFEGRFGLAPSAARLVWEYYGGADRLADFEELVRETDRMDSADLRPDDVTSPQRYIKLGYTIDGRSGLGVYEEYFHELVAVLREAPPVEEVLALPSVAERCRRLEGNDAAFRRALLAHSRVERNVVVTDFRDLESPPVGNRFLVYTLFPEANVSARLHWGPDREFVIMALGHSIFDRSCKTDVGELAARYGGGGHVGAASIPLIDEADFQIKQILAELKARG